MYWQYGVPYSSGLTETQELETLVCVSLAIICWSWVGGFVLGTLSGDTLYVNGTLFCLVWFCLCGPLWVLIHSLRLLLNAIRAAMRVRRGIVCRPASRMRSFKVGDEALARLRKSYAFCESLANRLLFP